MASCSRSLQPQFFEKSTQCTTPSKPGVMPQESYAAANEGVQNGNEEKLGDAEAQMTRNVTYKADSTETLEIKKKDEGSVVNMTSTLLPCAHGDGDVYVTCRKKINMPKVLFFMTKVDEDIIMDYDSGPNVNGFLQDEGNRSARGAHPGVVAAAVPLAENLTGLLNITSREAPIQFTLPLLGYAMPLLLVVTIIANTLVVVVLSQRHMRTPTNIVLLGMAICDMMTLLVPSPWYFYIYSLRNYETLLTPASACYAYNSMHEVIPNFFHTSSIWLTLLLAGQRYIYVCRPARARDWCTVPNVTRVMCWILALAFAHQLPRFFDRTFEDVQFRWNGRVLWGCSMRTASWVQTVFAEHAYYIAYYAFKVVFVNTGPCTALVVLNVLLFKALKRARDKRLRLFQEHRRKNECKRLRDSNCTTMMLIIVVTVFLLVEIPLAVTVLLHVLINTIRVRTVSYDSLNIVILFSNFFIMLSYPVNFAIYCGMSRQFRETFKDLFLVGSVVNRREGSSRYSIMNGPRPSANETLL